MFKRRRLLFSRPEGFKPQVTSSAKSILASLQLPIEPTEPSQFSDFSVLVINSSLEMAKEITMQLTLDMPGCSLMYAPTISLAQLILKKRAIDLVVSSQILPDGHINKLRDSLQCMQKPPAVVVVGAPHMRSADILGDSSYQFAKSRCITSPNAAAEIVELPSDKIASLGADLRNDLNNPLQEIVAMVFVAQNNKGTATATDSALLSIEKAAKNMSNIVNQLEDKIRSVVA